MKSKLLLLLTLLGVLGLTAPRAAAQDPAPVTSSVTITTALNVGDRMNIIFQGPDGTGQGIDVKGAKPVEVEGKIAYEITEKPVILTGDLYSLEITMSQVK